MTSWQIMRDDQEPVLLGINLTVLVLHLVHFCCEIWNSHNSEQKDYKMDKACSPEKSVLFYLCIRHQISEDALYYISFTTTSY